MMRLFSVYCVLSSAALAFARHSSQSADLGFCGLSVFEPSSWNPICAGSHRSVGAGIKPDRLQVNLHRARDKSTQAVVAAPSPADQASHWSYTPRCIRLHNSTEKYCVYTSSSFAKDRGISFFTTPEAAGELRKLPAFIDPQVLQGANEEPNPPYEARQLPGRGVGLIANKTLHRGDHIFSTTPLLVIEEDVFETFVESDRAPFETMGVRRLPDSSRQLFMNLCGHFGGDPVEDIINTNSFAIDLFEDDEETAYNAVFPEISRMNHDCRPNAHYYFDRRTLTQHVHALRTIMPGEEITISYIDPSQPRANRQHTLHQSWGFKCSCSLCTQPAPFTKASDDRIEHIEEIREELEDFSSSSQATPSTAELLVSLYEQERMYGPIAEAYTLAAIEFNGAGDIWMAQKYARLAVEAGLLYGGPLDDDLKEMERLLKDPKGHWSWMLRNRKRLQSNTTR